jgi:hypothetical protein
MRRVSASRVRTTYDCAASSAAICTRLSAASFVCIRVTASSARACSPARRAPSRDTAASHSTSCAWHATSDVCSWCPPHPHPRRDAPLHPHPHPGVGSLWPSHGWRRCRRSLRCPSSISRSVSWRCRSDMCASAVRSYEARRRSAASALPSACSRAAATPALDAFARASSAAIRDSRARRSLSRAAIVSA